MARKRYIDLALAVLDDPQLLWRSAFEGLNWNQRALILSLTIGPERFEVEELRRVWQAMLDAQIGPEPSMSFRRSLSTVEGTFVRVDGSISGSYVSLSNPSVEDFLVGYLERNPELISTMMKGICYFEQIEGLHQMASPDWSEFNQSVPGFSNLNDSLETAIHRLAARNRIRQWLSDCRDEFSTMIERLYLKPAMRRLDHGGQDPSNVLHIRVARLNWIFNLPYDFQPGGLWMADRLSEVVELVDQSEDLRGEIGSLVSLFNQANKGSENAFISQLEDLRLSVLARSYQLDSISEWDQLMTLDAVLYAAELDLFLRPAFESFLAGEVHKVVHEYQIVSLRRLADNFGPEERFALYFNQAASSLERADKSEYFDDYGEEEGEENPGSGSQGSSRSEDRIVRLFDGMATLRDQQVDGGGETS